MTLREIQAIALLEIGQWRGGLFPIRVGGGKTMLSLLAPRMVGAKRPLILIPAHLREKTQREMKTLRKHWVLPSFIRVESYQSLSRKGGADLLTQYAPDMIIADECHYLKNPSAACTKRVSRYMKQNYHDVVFVGMSGTITKRSIKDFAHLASWALKDFSPCPTTWPVMDDWCRALDVNVAPHRRLAPGALDKIKSHPFEGIRIAYQKRLTETPGVVASQDGPLPIALEINSHLLPSPQEFEPHWKALRKDWCTPDGWQCADGVEIWRHARELGLGMYYTWDPRPPQDWVLARAAWGSASREIIKNNKRHLDTELQVREAVQEGLYPQAARALADWTAIQKTFEPNVVPVWVSDHAIQWIVDWAKKAPGIVWVSHRYLGERLEKAGLPYYGSQGLHAPTGRQIEDAPPTRTIAASIAANGTGRNLQAWHRNLITGVPPNGAIFEQLLGRTHRDGQKNEKVLADVLMGCYEDVKGFWRAVEDAQYQEEITGQSQKMCYGDTENVLELEALPPSSSFQWRKD